MLGLCLVIFWWVPNNLRPKMGDSDSEINSGIILIFSHFGIRIGIKSFKQTVIRIGVRVKGFTGIGTRIETVPESPIFALDTYQSYCSLEDGYISENHHI